MVWSSWAQKERWTLLLTEPYIWVPNRTSAPASSGKVWWWAECDGCLKSSRSLTPWKMRSACFLNPDTIWMASQGWWKILMDSRNIWNESLRAFIQHSSQDSSVVELFGTAPQASLAAYQWWQGSGKSVTGSVTKSLERSHILARTSRACLLQFEHTGDHCYTVTTWHAWPVDWQIAYFPIVVALTVFCMWDWNPNLTKTCLFLWSVTDVTLQGSDPEIV